MGQPYVGEIRLFGGSFAPVGWADCNGQLLAIAENDTLFQLIGTTFGGDGESTFGLPDLRGRVPVHLGTGPDGTTYQLGEMAGVEDVTLTTGQIPNHTHALLATSAGGTQNAAGGNLLAQGPTVKPFINDSPSASLAPQSVSPVGGSQPHDNMGPSLVIRYIISLYGIFPSQT